MFLFSIENNPNTDIRCLPDEVEVLKQHFLQTYTSLGVEGIVPSEIRGHNLRAKLYYFRCSICPWWMQEEIRDPSQIPENWIQDRKIARQRLRQVLNEFGF